MFLGSLIKIKPLAATSAVLAGVGIGGMALGQTLPIAGNPQQAARADRDAIREVREQDEAALRTRSLLNRDARQEARQAVNPAPGGSDESNLRREAQGDLRNTNAMNSGLRGTDLGLRFNTRPGMNGLVVLDVATQGALVNSGFRQGDRIVSINGQPVTAQAQFVQALTSASAAQSANIVIDRNGAAHILAIQPGQLQTGQMSQRNPQNIGNSSGTLQPDMNQPNAKSNLRNLRTTGATGLSPAQGNLSTGANTVNQVDQAGLKPRGTLSPRTTTSAVPTVPSTIVGQTTTPGAANSSAPFAPAAATNASAIGTPGLTAPSQLPSTAGRASVINNGTSAVSGTGIGGRGTSCLSPANSGMPAFGAAGAQGATGTTGGTGSTAGGSGAVGGTGSMAGGTGSTAGGSGAVGGTGSMAGGTGSTAGGSGAVGGTGAAIGGTGSTAGPSGGSTSTGAIGAGPAAGAGVGAAGGVGAGGGGAAGGAGAGGT